jgi:hypothetical protein
MRGVWNRIETCKFVGFSNRGVETSGFVVDDFFVTICVTISF